MCGFVGSLSYKIINQEKISSSNEHLVCRGPDSKGTLFSNAEEIKYSFIFNRLSILDLSDKANQPMFSEDQNKIIMFNGEIFNHAELRTELQELGVTFKTSNSDTEVLLKGISYFGLDYVNKIRGQFAIFFLDKNIKTFYLIRDRLGQKPLYYNLTESTFSFSSNLKTLLEITDNNEICYKQVNEYLKYGAIKSPNTLFKNFKSVMPAEILTINYSKNEFVIKKDIYWDLIDYYDNKEFIYGEFEEILNESIKIRKTADVPVASFLSGGIDSTSIVRKLSQDDSSVNTFSVEVQDKNYDESKWSQQVADTYNTNHKSVQITSDISNTAIEEAISSLDEPYSDPSVVPSYLLSKEISKFYKVALSGDGGDELLGGYVRTNLSLLEKGFFSNLISKLYHIYPARLGTGNYFLSKSKDIKQRYPSFLEDLKLLKLLGIDSKSQVNNLTFKKKLNNYKSLLFIDYQFYLPEMMLFKIDRTAMANSLEIRSPFVDHKLIEYIFSHDNKYFINGISKEPLKRMLKSDFNDEFLNRKKQGFVFDIENWVFMNLDYIEEIFSNGVVVNKYNKNILKKLSMYKSRINAHRIWKLFVIEKYLESLKL